MFDDFISLNRMLDGEFNGEDSDIDVRYLPNVFALRGELAHMLANLLERRVLADVSSFIN